MCPMSFRKKCFINCHTGLLSSFFEGWKSGYSFGHITPVQISKVHRLSQKSQTERSAGAQEVKYMSAAGLDKVKAASGGTVAKRSMYAASEVGNHILASAASSFEPCLASPLVFQGKLGFWEFIQKLLSSKHL